MPIYEYRCEPCDNQFEFFIMSSSEQINCPQCESTEVTKLMSTFASVVPGGYKSAQMASGTSMSSSAGEASAPAPKTGGCGGGCACH